MTLIRSFTLWSGLLVIVSLLSLWIDGHGNHVSEVSYTSGALSVGIGSGPDGIRAGYHRSTGGPPPLWSPGFDYIRAPGRIIDGVAWVPLWFPPAIVLHEEKDNEISGVQAGFEVAHWFLLLIAAGAWAFLFRLRSCRLARATDSSSHSDG